MELHTNIRQYRWTGRRRAQAEGVMVGFSQLPEGCVSEILSSTQPGDACRLAAVCRGFKTAADSDMVWEKFLPSDYLEINGRSVFPLDFTTMTKKQIYFSLSSPILLDRGKLGFEIDEKSGKKCYTLPARELSIAWKDTPTHWLWISIPESRFSEVAGLRGVCWLDIMGKMKCKMLSPMTTYTAYLIFQFAERGSDFDSRPIKAFVEVTRESESSKEDSYGRDFNGYCLRNCSTVYLQMETFPPVRYGRLPRMTRSGWMEIELGDFFSSHLSEDDAIVTMRLIEIEELHGFHGLIVEGIQVRPKHA